MYVSHHHVLSHPSLIFLPIYLDRTVVLVPLLAYITCITYVLHQDHFIQSHTNPHPSYTRTTPHGGMMICDSAERRRPRQPSPILSYLSSFLPHLLQPKLRIRPSHLSHGLLTPCTNAISIQARHHRRWPQQ